jgi:hypothetical protein
VEEIWENNKKRVFESTERFFPHKILKKIPDPDYNGANIPGRL